MFYFLQVGNVIQAFKRLEKFAKSKIQEHRETFDPNNIRDFVDLYLQTEHPSDKYINGKQIKLTHQLPRDNQRDREQQTLLKSLSSHRYLLHMTA